MHHEIFPYSLLPIRYSLSIAYIHPTMSAGSFPWLA